ncbi:MAG TPA: SRPBCC family protein [bacterium]|nr:SRPBCC family protein [bacterium]
MRSNTEHVTIDVDHRHLFAFLADPDNLPKWAVGFCRAIRREGERWLVQTPQGEVAIRFVTHPSMGIIDFYISPAPGTEVAAFSRVLPNGGGSEYIFTQFQIPGMPDDVFGRQVRALKEELVVLRALMHAQAACPA